MDRRNLVEELQKAFQEDERERATKDSTDVEYLENTNTLRVNEQKVFEDMMKNAEPKPMSEEELFGRLLKERRSSKQE